MTNPTHADTGRQARWRLRIAALATAVTAAVLCASAAGGPTASAHLRTHAVTTVKIVSDLPLHGGDRAQTLQMVHAIRFVLQQSGYKAGKYRVRFESHDDSIASRGEWDESRCGSNARSYRPTRRSSA